MPGTYGVYYDFAAHLKFEKMTPNERMDMIAHTIPELHGDIINVQTRLAHKEFYKYAGIVNSNDSSESNDVRLSSIPCKETPICVMTYNHSGYEYHCRQYNEYVLWEKNRNPVRHESNLNKNYNAKNLCECMRLTTMTLELAETGGEYIVTREKDRQLLLDIRAHKYEYDELIRMCEEISERFAEASKKTKLQEHVDWDFLRDLMIDYRKYVYNSKNSKCPYGY